MAAMSFQSGDTWPIGLLTNFSHARAKRTSFENRYYGPYDKLLNYCFGESFTFYIAPQNPLRDDSRDSVIFLVVFDGKDRPVLLVEVKDDSWAEKAELRYCADDQIRGRCALMLDDCPLPRLWGLSLLGTSARVWCGDKATYEVSHHCAPGSFARSFANLLSWGVGHGHLDGGQICEDEEIVTDILAHAGDN